ncbi:Hypothetical protein LUCI_2938 [Lucifera butyrica]|uniref:PAS domain-containing protein n=1 Tax=Lucifera butyrica TaxID=1351585 RepID=A0A498RC14_9FIRM|nr:PAS domain S-box protein [Lucifera butyrica]VBB07673.1 Hypothetical protein LUCI_2938 [Lucifera butyrica]
MKRKAFSPLNMLEPMESFFSQILNSTPQCILLIDVKTNLIVYANKTCEDLYGYTQEELLGVPMDALNSTGRSIIQKEMQGVKDKYPKAHCFKGVHTHQSGVSIEVEIVSKLTIIHNRQYFLYNISSRDRREKYEASSKKFLAVLPGGIRQRADTVRIEAEFEQALQES